MQKNKNISKKKKLKKHIVTHSLHRKISGFSKVSPKRKGKCKQCGECCKLGIICPFLTYDSNGKAKCMIYKIRPSWCKKYPRVPNEFDTKDVCGYWFEEKEIKKK
ncbi:MAG TPA: hypothetical protein PKK56_01160 [archaeon]|jgi:Fe-S-cluster containining protein|nr:hypothetical protein [archaeon]HRT02525.1 hypothetical protein [Candidatus Diapherotrites archaeon]